MWTKTNTARLLRASDHAVERAMVDLYDRQVLNDKASVHAKRTNPRGFHAVHRITGSYYAIMVLAGRRLTGYHLASARNIALQHASQLADEANARADRNAERAMP
jgi:hypothetical protein